MNTREMSDDTRLPGHQYTLGEMRKIIATLRAVNDRFYWDAFHAGAGSACHAFIEFAGLQAKFIDMCEQALVAGIEFPFANRHSRTPWPMETHHAEYLGEKFHCIFGFALAADPKLREAFIREGLDADREKPAMPAEDSL
jgi:hypothetical protein